jgi:tRNA(fMet)-specific endonuclease VapC
MEVKVLIDTSAFAGFRLGNADVVERIRASDLVLFSSIVFGELLVGFRRGSRFKENMTHLQRFLDHDAVRFVEVGEVTADRFSRIAIHLRRQGTPIPENDIWIAAQAMEHGAELLTFDRHFERIGGLACTVLP